MKLKENTIFITGGGSGIGLALAESFQIQGNQVIICGRNPAKLARAQRDVPGLITMSCDITDEDNVQRVVAHLESEFPTLNVLVNNAGVLYMDDFYRNANGLGKIENEIDTNFLGPVRLTGLLLPQLARQPEAAILNVSSGIAYVPMAGAAVYSATKAAMHSWTRALRYQLQKTPVKVFELLPPTVDTAMTRDMDGEKITPEVLAKATLEHMEKDKTEIRVGQARALYFMSRIAPTMAERLLQNV
jgi:uncharacterized oxidoreductase